MCVYTVCLPNYITVDQLMVYETIKTRVCSLTARMRDDGSWPVLNSCWCAGLVLLSSVDIHVLMVSV